MAADDDEGEKPLQYIVETSDRAELDLEAHFLRLTQIVSPHFAGEWYADLRRALRELEGFPGPLSHARDEDASAALGLETRRLLYFGPGKRRSGISYRVLFTIVPPLEGEDEGVIRVLRILHGAQQLASVDAPEGDDAREGTE